jgi:hypothetical protein
MGGFSKAMDIMKQESDGCLIAENSVQMDQLKEILVLVPME